MNVALLADPSEFFEVDPVTSTFLLVISTALGTWLFSTIIIAVITESFLKCKAEIAARLAASEQEKLQWMKVPRVARRPRAMYVPVLRPHNIVERVAAITEKAASGALATVRGNTSRFISVRSVRSHASDDNRWRRAARASSTRRARAPPPPSSPTSVLARPAPAAPTPGAAARRRELEIRRFAPPPPPPPRRRRSSGS